MAGPPGPGDLGDLGDSGDTGDAGDAGGTGAPTASSARRKWLRGGLQTGALLAGGAVAGMSGFALHHWLTVAGMAGSSDAGKAAPHALWTTAFNDLDGRSVSLSAFKGRPLVVNFWASWCAPCLEEMPDFQRASQTTEGKRVHFAGIGIDYAKNMKPFAVKLGISYLLLEGGAQALDLVKAAGNSSGALPFTLILDRTGAVALRKLGKMTYAELMAAVTSF